MSRVLQAISDYHREEERRKDAAEREVREHAEFCPCLPCRCRRGIEADRAHRAAMQEEPIALDARWTRTI